MCGAKSSESHFGGLSCRACAAFFRRYVNSKKPQIECTCSQKFDSSGPCRYCRMLKCVEVGMAKCKVQATRQKNKEYVFLPCAITNISLLSCNIIPRSCSKLTCTVKNWPDLDKKRRDLYGGSMYNLNFTQFSNRVRQDTTIFWDLAESIFSEIGLLNSDDKDALLCNFFPRWMLMEAAIEYCKNYEHHWKMIETDGLDNMLLVFYGSSMPKEKRLDDDKIIQIFRPYWTRFYIEIAEPIHQEKCDKVEFMALFLLILFDDAYLNISEEAAKLCRNLQKVILRELKGYQMDNNCSEMRFMDVISKLSLFERGEKRLQEEIVICDVIDISLDEDFKTIMHIKKL